MSIIQLNKLEYGSQYNLGGAVVHGFQSGEIVYMDTTGIIIKPIIRDCIDQHNVTNSFSIGSYFVKKRVCSNIDGVVYWQSPEEIQKLVREEYKYAK